MRTIISIVALIALSSGVAAQQSTGLIFMERDQYFSVPPAALPLRGQAPHYVDLSRDFPEPGMQGQQQSCVAWAVAYGLKSFQKNREYRVQGLTKRFRFSPAFVYNQIRQKSCAGGSLIADALNVMETQGALPMEQFHYDEQTCSKLPTESQAQAALEFRIARWMRVNVQSDTELKAQLTRGYPIIIGMKVYDTFRTYDGKEVYKISIAEAGKFLGGHAMVLVGYADQIQAYKVMNSWGKDWGAGGYAWIDYATLRSMTQEGYVAIDIFLDRVAENSSPADLPEIAAAPTPSPPPSEPAPPAASEPVESPAPQVLGVAVDLETKAEPPALPLPKPKTVLTTEVLEAAVRSTTEPRILFKTKENFNVRPYSAWLELPDELAKTIKYVEYSFIAPGFINPKRSLPDSNIFIVKWRGFGCVTDARVVAYLKNGKNVYGQFNLCDVQERT